MNLVVAFLKERRTKILGKRGYKFCQTSSKRLWTGGARTIIHLFDIFKGYSYSFKTMTQKHGFYAHHTYADDKGILGSAVSTTTD